MERTEFAILVIAIVGLSSCQRSTTVTTATGEKLTITNDGTQLTFEGPGGETTQISMAGEGTMSLPETFPQDVPVYENTRVVMVASEASMTTATLETADGVEEIATYYLSRLGEQGWQNTSDTRTPDAAIISAERAGRQLVVSISRDQEGPTYIALNIAQR